MATVTSEKTASPGERLAASPRRWRWLASIVILLHLGAVFTPPFRFASRSPQGEPSPLAESAYRALQPYINAAYLDHGYFYFAPNPGPSHLVRYEVDQGEGREPLTGVFPYLDPKRPRILGTQQPRVIYHRHFMLAESLHANFTPPDPPENLPENEELRQAVLEDWKQRRQRYLALKKSYEQHLSHVHGGRPVKIVRIEHRQPTPVEYRDGMMIDDPSTYRDLPETSPLGAAP